MAAIVTDTFRRNNAQFFLSDISSSDTNYYLGIGKSDKWALDEEALDLNIPVPLGIPSDDSDVKANLTTLIKINSVNCDLVIPNIKWKVNSRYKEYNPADPDCFYHSIVNGNEINPCYAIISGRIYLCLKSGNSVTSNVPTSVDYRAQSYGSDGYVWILVDNISTINANINTDQFISISSGVVSESIQPLVATDGGGLLYGFSVLNGGNNYSISNTVTFVARRVDNSVTNIVCPVTISPTGQIENVMLPTNYSYTDINSKNIIDGYFIFDSSETGSDAVIVPRVAPLTGFAYNPSSILPSWFVGVSIDAIDNILGDGFYTPYRQISILKNIEYSDQASVDSIGALRYFIIPSAPPVIPSVGSVLKINTNVKAYFDAYSVVSNNGIAQHRIYFHQNSTTGFGLIPTSGTITMPDNSTVNYLSLNNNEYIANSGDVIFTENRRKINRQSSQTEEIKIIIQF